MIALLRKYLLEILIGLALVATLTAITIRLRWLLTTDWLTLTSRMSFADWMLSLAALLLILALRFGWRR